MTPNDIEKLIRTKAAEMNLSEALDAYGYEAVEAEIFNNVFSALYGRSPDVVNGIIEGELDFYLSPVEEDAEE